MNFSVTMNDLPKPTPSYLSKSTITRPCSPSPNAQTHTTSTRSLPSVGLVGSHLRKCSLRTTCRYWWSRVWRRTGRPGAGTRGSPPRPSNTSRECRTPGPDRNLPTSAHRSDGQAMEMIQMADPADQSPDGHISNLYRVAKEFRASCVSLSGPALPPLCLRAVWPYPVLILHHPGTAPNLSGPALKLASSLDPGVYSG